MKLHNSYLQFAALAVAFGCMLSGLAQTPDRPPQREGGPPPPSGAFPPPEGGPDFDGPPPFGPPPFGPGGFGPGGPGGMMQETKLVKQFDKDGDRWLNNDERKAAREFLQKERAEGRGRRGPGGTGGGLLQPFP